MRYAFISENRREYRLRLLCKAMNVTRQGYYVWLKRKPTDRERANSELGDLIESIFHQYKRRYGVKRIQDELKDRGVRTSKRRISRLMRERELETKGKKKFRVTTDSKHKQAIAPNTLNREFAPAVPNQVWAGDITYIWTQQGWVYLAVFLDLFSRKVVGWATSDTLETSFVLLAFERALARRAPGSGLLVHTDRGSQYASNAFKQVLTQGHFELSMSRKGNCWDNSVSESFFARFKVEAIHGETFHTREDLEYEVFDYIERFYNKIRKHSTIEYLSPNQYECLFNNKEALAA